ncbi:hypothetical protein [Fictibacillus sp. KU28468]|uniref:hypothetical protein n=1 Tax=Fictibacillus sp. KU28468 TaxID=2991053 RepID=UPI00223DD368|nr:hypothetical protein [Fictibacillus sp. KU28468]UZJ77714.1 hypothetical protein OKX00_16290 [Fictibacillus sp. KU28468]
MPSFFKFIKWPGAAVSTRASYVYQKDQLGLKRVSASIVPQGLKISEQVEDDRFTAHTHAHNKQMGQIKEKVKQ